MSLVEQTGPAVVSSVGAGPLTTASFTPPVGSLLVAMVVAEYGGATTPTIAMSDSQSASWTSAVLEAYAVGGARGADQIFYRIITTSASMTVTATFTNLVQGCYLNVKVLTGQHAVPIGGTNTYQSASTTVGTFSVTTTVAGSSVYGCSCNVDNTSALTPNANTGAMQSPLVDAGGAYITGWASAAPTGTPGATTFGGTWGTAAQNHAAAAEILPAMAPQVIISQAINRASRW